MRAYFVDTIVRGQENVPLSIGGYDISAYKPRLTQHTNKNVVVPSLGFTPIVNKTSGSGVIWAHTLGKSSVLVQHTALPGEHARVIHVRC